ncbi:MAG: hypothetical protein AAFW95_06795 [Cyanobacteria bacterium J06638_6]
MALLNDGMNAAPSPPSMQEKGQGVTWQSQFSDCKMVDFHAAPPDEAVFEVSLRQSLPVTIAQYTTDFAIAHALPQRAGLLALQYETDSQPLVSVQVSQAP